MAETSQEVCDSYQANGNDCAVLTVTNVINSVRCDTVETAGCLSVDTSDIYVHQDDFDSASPSAINEQSEEVCFPILTDFRKKFPNKLLFGHLNVNSIRYKMSEVEMMLNNLDILGLSETKIDESFPDAQFNVNGYNLFRQDRNAFGGGLMFYVTNTIPSRRRNYFVQL
jgi:hypothetical protein